SLANKDLPHDGPSGFCGGPKRRIVSRYVAPAQHNLSFFADNLSEQLLTAAAIDRFDRQEYHADSVISGLGQGHAKRGPLFAEEPIWSLEQNAGAVSRVLFATTGTAVFEVNEDLQSLLDQIVALAGLEVDDKSYATGVMLIARIVEPLAG